jgi:hypothetical protein
MKVWAKSQANKRLCLGSVLVIILLTQSRTRILEGQLKVAFAGRTAITKSDPRRFSAYLAAK